MLGNIAEYCRDWLSYDYTGSVDPLGATSGSSRVCRGGRWNYPARYAIAGLSLGYAANAYRNYADMGCRLVVEY